MSSRLSRFHTQGCLGFSSFNMMIDSPPVEFPHRSLGGFFISHLVGLVHLKAEAQASILVLHIFRKTTENLDLVKLALMEIIFVNFCLTVCLLSKS